MLEIAGSKEYYGIPAKNDKLENVLLSLQLAVNWKVQRNIV